MEVLPWLKCENLVMLQVRMFIFMNCAGILTPQCIYIVTLILQECRCGKYHVSHDKSVAIQNIA